MSAYTRTHHAFYVISKIMGEGITGYQRAYLMDALKELDEKAYREGIAAAEGGRISFSNVHQLNYLRSRSEPGIA